MRRRGSIRLWLLTFYAGLLYLVLKATGRVKA